jgi:uncharacterized protein
VTRTSGSEGGGALRLLAVADEPPPVDAAELVASNKPDVVVTLGDLPEAWLLGLAEVDVPRLGVHGNHDREHLLSDASIRDLHLQRAEVGGWSFAGFEGCVRYADGPHQYTQEEACALARHLPHAEVLLCHCPPAGVNDEPDDPAHAGFRALREWVERHAPRYLLHGHTTPDPRTRSSRLGETAVIWVRGAHMVVLEREPGGEDSPRSP